MLGELEIGRTGALVELDRKDERKYAGRGEHLLCYFPGVIIVSYVSFDDRQDFLLPSFSCNGDAADHADVLVGGVLSPRPGFINVDRDMFG